MSDSSRWYTAMQLATIDLPGLPVTERGVQKVALRECWPSRPRAGRGGGREYPLSALPPAAQAILLARPKAPANDTAPAKDATPAASSQLWVHYDRKPDSIKAEARRRLDAVTTVATLMAGGTRKLQAVAAAAIPHQVPVPTLRRWLVLIEGIDRTDWLPALAPRWTGRTATREIDPRAFDFFKADYLRPNIAAAAAYRRLQDAAKAQGWAVPPLKTLERRLARELSPTAVTYAREGASALKRMYPAQQRDRTTLRALECVCADGRKHDLFVEWPDGTKSRPISVVWQDIHSGMILAWRVDQTESKELVRLSFGDLVETWGVPDAALLDNGRAFASKWITGGMANRFRFKVKAEEPEGVLTALGVQVHWATPYSGQSKPIERAFRDFAQDLDCHIRFAGAWCGNRPDARPEEYDGRAVKLADFMATYAEVVAQHNAREGRRSPTVQGRSFKAVFEESYRQHPPRRATAAQRALWLLAVEGVTARAPDGAVNLGGNRYWCEALSRLIGQQLVLRFDPQQLDAPVKVYALDGRFVAEAPCQEAAGFLSVDAARQHSRARNEWTRAQKQMLNAENRMSALEAATLLPAPAATPSAAAPETKIVRMFSKADPEFVAARQESNAAKRAAEEAAFEAGLDLMEERQRRAGLA